MSRTPSAESSRQSPGHGPTAGMFPTQRPPIHPTPVETLTFCSSVKEETSWRALACAAAQAGPKSGMRGEPGGGGVFGDDEGSTLGMGEAEGTGKEEKG